MRKILSSLLLLAATLLSQTVSAQQDKNMVIHFKDNTTQTVDLAGVDSLTFEQRKQVTDFTADISVLSVENQEALVQVQVSDQETLYLCYAVPKAQWDFYGNIGLEPAEAVLDSLSDNLVGGTNAQTLYMMGLRGDKKLNYVNLRKNTDYVVFAAQMSLEGEVMSEVFTTEFNAGQRPQSGITFDIALSNITDYNVDVTITPSDPEARYSVMVDLLEFMPEDDEEIANELADIVRYSGGEVTVGPVSYNYNNMLNPGSDYYLAVVGLNEDNYPNTDLFKVFFTTTGTAPEYAPQSKPMGVRSVRIKKGGKPKGLQMKVVQ